VAKFSIHLGNQCFILSIRHHAATGGLVSIVRALAWTFGPLILLVPQGALIHLDLDCFGAKTESRTGVNQRFADKVKVILRALSV
jgi:hypothetical protein